VGRSPRRHRAFAGRKSSRLTLNHKWFLFALSIVIVIVLLLVLDPIEVEFEHEHEHEHDYEHGPHYCIGRCSGGS
jgi:hypothetical protein